VDRSGSTFVLGIFYIAWIILRRFSEAYSANSIAKLDYRHHLDFSDWSKLAQNFGVGQLHSVPNSFILQIWYHYKAYDLCYTNEPLHFYSGQLGQKVQGRKALVNIKAF